MDVLSLILAVIGAICALLQVFISIFSLDSFNSSLGKQTVDDEDEFEDSERFIKRSRVVLVLLFVSIVVSLVLWQIPQKYDWIEVVSYINPLVCMLLFSGYAIMAKRSFNTYSIIAPKGLWEVLFNKIPSYIEKAEGPYRIVLTQIGDIKKEDLSKLIIQGPKGENHPTLPAGDIFTLVKTEYEKATIDSGKPLYRFDEYQNIKLVPSSQEPGLLTHGIIVFVGAVDSFSLVTNALARLAKNNPYVPIAYYSFSKYPGKTHTPPYTRLNNKAPKDFVNYLILRHYIRCGYWKKLCNKYHRYFVGALILLGSVLAYFAINPLSHIKAEQKPLPSPSAKMHTATKLTTVFFEGDSPTRVKVWKKVKDKPKNIFNSGDGGNLSDWPQEHDSSMVMDIMKARVACLWIPKDYIPITLWTKTGKRIKGSYERNDKVYVFEQNKFAYSVSWRSNTVKSSTLEDNRIRFFYSYDGDYAVEIVYDPDQYYKVSRKLLRSSLYLSKLQQFLLSVEILDQNGLFVTDSKENKDFGESDNKTLNSNIDVVQ